MENLEDHIGDVVRKAIEMANVPIMSAAKAAGMDAVSFNIFLQSGEFKREPNFKRLAEILDLDSGKLENLARGWTPQQINTKNWNELRKITSTCSNNTVNCFLIWEPGAKKAALFDTGFDENLINEHLKKHSLELEYLFITHNHLDHCGLADLFARKFPDIKIYRANFTTLNEALYEKNQQPITFGNLTITPIPLPGHTYDSMIYIVTGWKNSAPVAVVGDALFAGSMGRLIIEPKSVKKAIIENLFSLPSDTLICPGHGPLTTVEEEIRNNPFFKV
ncbi:MAG: MBL fold metallo-hydrolase [Verrucomicrobiia bacterium]|jgi:glyoxylase-like metal-dependent hydrolase (beta-lactamase superfamily II)